MAKIDRLTSQVQEHLDEGEEILYTVLGTYETKLLGEDSIRTGAFFATNKRLVFFAKKLVGYEMEVFPYSSISSIETSKGFMGHKLSFFSSGNKVSMKWIQEGDVKGLVNFVKENVGKRENSNVAGDNVSALEKLASLRDKGVLSEEEFLVEKKKIIGV